MTIISNMQKAQRILKLLVKSWPHLYGYTMASFVTSACSDLWLTSAPVYEP